MNQPLICRRLRRMGGQAFGKDAVDKETDSPTDKPADLKSSETSYFMIQNLNQE